MAPERVSQSKILPSETTRELVKSLHGVSPAFRAWLKNSPQETVNDLVATLVERGLAEDTETALLHLNELTQDIPRDIPLTKFDLHGWLRRKNTPKGTAEDNNNFWNGDHWQMGSIGHQAVVDILTGKVIGRQSSNQYRQQSFPDWLPMTLPSAERAKKHKKRVTVGQLSPEYLARIDNCLGKLTEKLSDGSRVLTQNPTTINELRLLLLPVFGQHLAKLDQYRRPLEGQAYLLTLATWANLVKFCQEAEKPILFNEIPILGHPKQLRSSNELSVGEPDSIEVREINGQKPDKSAAKLLAHLAKTRYQSVVNLIRTLNESAGGQFKFKIWEWKFAVGDSGSPTRFIQREDVEERPLPRHEQQVREYLTYCTVAQILACGGDWPKTSLFEDAEIVYFLPTGEPLTHRIHMSAQEQKEFLKTNIAPSLGSGRADEYALARTVENLFKQALNQNGHYMSKIDMRQALLLPIEATETKLMSPRQIIGRYRAFADEQQIIERAGTRQDGTPFFVMHIDKLLEAIATNKIHTRGFSPQYGGLISCLLPDHDDSTPSMYIYLKTGSFYCFGCKAHGQFSLNSLPRHIDLPVVSWQGLRARVNGAVQEVVIPKEHEEVMGFAQEQLQKNFWGSQAEEYLHEKRGLDPDLAWSLGAGYGKNLIGQLLKEGITREKLTHYGFLDRNGRPVLEDRVTFPLVFPDGAITNFYGRAVYPCESALRHRKLSVEKTGVPQGGFNMEILKDSPDEVVLVEGAMDALALVQMGYPKTVAIIGTGNHRVLEEISLGTRNLALAFDNDLSGQRATDQVLAQLEQIGFQGSIRHFTDEYLLNNPEFAPYDDFSAYYKSLTPAQFTPLA